jgi:hypothetical protein
MPVPDEKSTQRSDANSGAPPPIYGPDLSGATQGVPIGTRSNEAAQQMPPHYTQGAPPPIRRVNVNFSEQAYQTLEDLARASGKSMSEILREAIALKAWFDTERAAGNRVLVERKGGDIREVISV